MFRVEPPGHEPSHDTLQGLIDFGWLRRQFRGVTPTPGAGAGAWLRGRVSGRFFTGASATSKDVLHPVIFLGRGGRKASAWSRSWWKAADRGKKQAVLPLLAVAIFVALRMSYGLALLALVVFAVLAWFGWERKDKNAVPEAHAKKLQSIYDGLMPYFGGADKDPDGKYKAGGAYAAAKVFEDAGFSADDSLTSVKITYPKYFKVTEAGERKAVETAVAYVAGGSNLYHFRWDPADKKLHVVMLLAAPSDPDQGPMGPAFPDQDGVVPPVPPADSSRDEHTLVLQEAVTSGSGIESVPAVPVD